MYRRMSLESDTGSGHSAKYGYSEMSVATYRKGWQNRMVLSGPEHVRNLQKTEINSCDIDYTKYLVCSDGGIFDQLQLKIYT